MKRITRDRRLILEVAAKFKAIRKRVAAGEGKERWE